MKEVDLMKQRKTDEKGFTLIEVIVTMILVGITAALAGMWIVSVANGYIFAKMNASTTQKAQLAMTRLVKEFSAISAITAATADSITYTRNNSTLGSLTGQIVSKIGGDLKLNTANTLTDSVNTFVLSYCDDIITTSGTPSQTCGASWSSTSRIIVITLTITGANNTTSTFTQRVTPRNL